MPRSDVDDVLEHTPPVPTRHREPKAKPRRRKRPGSPGNSRAASETSGVSKTRANRKRRRPRKPPEERWTHGRNRYNIYLEIAVKEDAEDRVWAGESAHKHLSGTVNELLANWADGLYDDVHAQLDHWPKQND